MSVDFVEAVESDTIRLRCTKQEFDQLDVAVDVQFLPADTDPMPFHATDTAHSAGSGRPEPIYSDRIPVGEVEIVVGTRCTRRTGGSALFRVW